MDNLLKQLRVRFSDLGEENQDDPYYAREGRIPPQKTVSFKGERKKAQNWFQRQFSGQMSDIDDSLDSEFETATAVAAAAFAVTSLKEKEEGSLNKKRSDEELRRSLTRTKSKRDESTEKPNDYTKISRWFSVSGESSMRKSATLDQRLEDEIPGKAMGITPTIKKTPTFSEKYLSDPGSKRFDQGPRKEQLAPHTIKPTASSSRNGKWDETTKTVGSSKVETKADAWEEAKLAKIKKRYEKLISTILEWENEKKTKAKRRMDRKEREIEQRRARDLQEFRNEMARIDKIAGGARALADERKRNDENKTIEKARVLRSTGKLPNECFCF